MGGNKTTSFRHAATKTMQSILFANSWSESQRKQMMEQDESVTEVARDFELSDGRRVVYIDAETLKIVDTDEIIRKIA